MELIIPNTTEMWINIAAFAVLFFVLAKFAFPPITKMLDERAAKIRESLEKAEDTRVEAERLLEEYKVQMAEARSEATQVIEQGRKMGDGGGGVLLIGTKGTIMCSTYGGNPRILPESRMKEVQQELKEKGGPKIKLDRSPGIAAEWIQAIKEGKKELATTNFDYSGPLVETMLLGMVAIRMADKNLKLEWDGETGKFTNLEEANNYLHQEYRKGWTL